MPVNPFQVAVSAGLDKTYSAKKYFMEVLGLTEEQAEAKLAEISAQGE